MATPVVYRKYKNDEQKAKLYNHRMAVAEEEFSKWKDDAKRWWERYENQPLKSQASAKGLVVNVPTGTATIDALFSGLTAIDVSFNCEAMANATPEQAILAETALNQEWMLCAVDEDRNDAIKDSLITGIGWVKVGYDFYTMADEVERDPEEIRAEVQRLIEDAVAAGEQAPTPDIIAKLVPSMETIEVALRDRIIVDYVPWDKVRFDPAARRWKDVRWVAQMTKQHIEEVRTNPLWREYAKRTRGGLSRLENVAPDSSIDRDLLIDGRTTDDDARVTVIEMWDLESGTVCTFLKGMSWLLYESVNPFALHPDFPDRSPYVPLVLRKTTRRVRGISDMDVIMRSLNEKNLYRSRTATYIERVVPKLIGPEDALTEEGKVALSSSEIGAYVSTSREVDPQSIQPLTAPILPTEAFGMNDRIDNEIREATGVNELMRGLFPDRKRTATETASVVTASAARQSEKRNTLEKFHVEIAKRMLHLMMQFYEQPRMARFVDPTMGNVPWEFSGADIIGDFDIRVNLEPRENPTKDQERQDATVMLNVLGPFAQPGPDGSSILDQRTLLAWFMRRYGLSRKDINELFNSEEEQEEQTMKALGVKAAATAAQQAAIPQEIQAGAMGGFGPGAPQAVEQVMQAQGVPTVPPR